MNLGPRLRRAMQHEAARAETSLHPDDIVRKARRRHRAVVMASSAAATVVVVLAFVVGVPMLVSQPDSGPDTVLPAGPTSESGSTDEGTPTRGAEPPVTSHASKAPVPLRFEVRAENPFAVRGVEGPANIAFFAEFMPMSEVDGGPSARIPAPKPGSGYTSVRLRDPGGDGTYSVTSEVRPGRYLVTIFAGQGVRHTSNGAYPAAPAELISQRSHVVRDAVVTVSESRTITAVYPSGPTGSTKPSESSSTKRPPRDDGFSLEGKSGTGTATGKDPAVLASVDVQRREGVDVIRLRFAPGTGIADYEVRYQPKPLRYEGSGKPANMQGGPALAVTLKHAGDGESSSGAVLADPKRQSVVAEVKNLGAFEGHVKLGIGLIEPIEKQPFRLSTSADTITIQIAHPGR